MRQYAITTTSSSAMLMLMLLCTVFAGLSRLAIATPSGSHACVIDSTRRKVCGFVLPVRRDKPSTSISNCMQSSSKHLSYANALCWSTVSVARLDTVGPVASSKNRLRHGPSAMFHDALSHTQQMSNGEILFRRVPNSKFGEFVDCDLKLVDDTVAVIDAVYHPDPVALCTQAWEALSDHARVTSNAYDFVVTAIHMNRGKTWCTKTFAITSTTITDSRRGHTPVRQQNDCMSLPDKSTTHSISREVASDGQVAVVQSKTASKLSKSNQDQSRAERHLSSQIRAFRPDGPPDEESWRPSKPALNLQGNQIPVPHCEVREMGIAHGGRLILGSDCSVPERATLATQGIVRSMVMSSPTLMGMLHACGDVAQGTLTSDKGGLAVFAGYFRVPGGEHGISNSWRALFAHEVIHACMKIGHSRQQDDLVASCLCEWNLPRAHYITQSSPGYIKQRTCDLCGLDC